MTLFRLSLIRTPRQVAHRYLTTLGIRREDPNRIWERRVPLTPEAVRGLVKEGKDVAVEVESCKRRCFPDMSYSQAGATVVPSLTKNVDVVLGIKEPPVAEVEKLLRKEEGKKRAWMVFSHTHKGQRYNTELLSTFMDKHQSQSLIDHELLTAPTSDGSLKRVAAFGWYAGAVGAGESLSMTGLALLQRGIATPLLNLPRPYTFPSLDEYKAGLGAAGEAIRNGPLVPSGPIVIGLTGAGNVSQGAKAMLDALGVEWLKPEDLTAINERDATKLYACAVPPNAYFARGDGTYSRDDYYASPSSYTSTFATKIAPYLTTLINGAGWKADFPRVMTDEDIEGLIQRSHGVPKLAAVQDVTCDLKGNLEFIDRHTTIDEPHFKGPAGILISAVDILPTELAKDASKHFSKCLLPYIKHISNPSSTDKVAQETLDRATIVRAGALTADHQWLQPRVDELRGGSSAADTPAGQARQQQVLLLGSGLVAGPAVEVFAARSDVRLVIGSNNVTEAQALVRDRENVQALGLDVGDAEALSRAVSESDVVVSLLPAPMHVKVAQHCIAHGKHLVTASYISPEMKELSDKAEQSDIVILGECGLDPGIDSMAAMRIMDRVKQEGKKVTSFISWCGGLPEPAASNVPLGYKFSWSPKAVLTAAQNDAKFKLGGEMRTIPGQNLLKEYFGSVNLWKGLSLEGLANRDSLPYAEKYGLGPVEQLRDVFRGTLRYKGFSEVLDAFRQMGLLSTEPLATQPQSWDELLVVSQRHISSGPATAQESLAQEAKDALHSLFDSASTVPFPQLINAAPIDYFAALLSHQLAYLPHERDSALLHHAFKLKAPGDDKEQNVTASLLCYGTDEGSAMSITVGKTLAFAALRVLDGHVKGRGVKGPYEREVWEGVLQSLEEVGVRVEEKWE